MFGFSLKIQLHSELYFPRVRHGVEDSSERANRSRRYARAWIGKVCMIQNVEEFGTKLGAPSFRDQKLLEDAGVQILDSGPVKQPRGAVSERANRGNRKGRGIQVKTGRTSADKLRRISGGVQVGIAHAVRTALVASAGLAL